MFIMTSDHGLDVVGMGIAAVIVFVKIKDILKNEKLLHALLQAIIIADRSPKVFIKGYLNALEIIIDLTLPKNVFLRKFQIYLNSSLILTISNITKQLAASTPEQRKSKTIVGMMLGDKIRSSSKSQILLFLALLAHLVFSGISFSNFNGFVSFIIAVGFLAIYFDHKLIEYRVNKGWYGRNGYEAREIINYILSHSNKDDFNDKGGFKRIIPNAEIETAQKPGREFDGAFI